MVSLPFGYEHEASGSYPVVYVLDAENYLFPLLATVARTEHYFASRRKGGYPNLIVVGIVADIEDQFSKVDAESGHVEIDVPNLWTALRESRARDYLPTAAESPWGVAGAGSLKDISGHASEFCKFVATVLVPFIDTSYRTIQSQRAVVGKSFGGSCVAHMMIEPNCIPLFSHFLLCSPSIAWDDEAFFRLEEESHESRPELKAAVLVCKGECEGSSMLIEKFKQVLESRGCSDLRVTTVCFPGEDHGSASYPFAYRSLKWLAEQLAEKA